MRCLPLAGAGFGGLRRQLGEGKGENPSPRRPGRGSGRSPASLEGAHKESGFLFIWRSASGNSQQINTVNSEGGA